MDLTILFAAILLVVVSCKTASYGYVGFKRSLNWIHVQNISLPFTTALSWHRSDSSPRDTTCADLLGNRSTATLCSVSLVLLYRLHRLTFSCRKIRIRDPCSTSSSSGSQIAFRGQISHFALGLRQWHFQSIRLYYILSQIVMEGGKEDGERHMLVLENPPMALICS